VIELPGYSISEQLYESDRTLVFRGTQDNEDRTVILKSLTSEYPKVEELGRRQHEFDIINSIESKGVIDAYALVEHQHSLVLVLEDFYQSNLKHQLPPNGFELKEALSISIDLAETIGNIHQQSVIHGDINPSNILLDFTSGQTKIIDFDLATRLSRQTPSFRDFEILEGTLSYMSPEQTGRMNRDIDYRSDLYSFGVTLYEMFTGQLPFQSDDPMELIHRHIAQIPVPPQELNPNIPPSVSDIIMKLLSKTAEDRYQGSYGLKADLEACLQKADQIDTAVFDIGRLDIPNQFSIPQKLYGREHEISTMMDTFDRASVGRSELMLVSGTAGIGKTSLVNEIHRPVLQKRGFFVSGKYDPLHQNIPYSSIIYAFMDHIIHLLTEKDDQIDLWKQKLEDVLGSIGQVLVEVIPEMELIIGKQPPVPKLQPQDAQNRFNQAFQQFIGVFAQPDHPLVIFLDDLQWADSASLQLIKLFLTDANTKHLLIIGAYRDNEVTSSHPLMLVLDEIKATGKKYQSLKLSALTEDHLNHLCADTLFCDESVSLDLARLVVEKTQGNPFFINQFLYSLYENNLLEFDVKQGRWLWDLAKITEQSITSNVVDLMIEKIENLSPATQDLVKFAACIGSRFTLSTLSHVCEKSGAETAGNLWEALQEGLIQPIGGEYRLVGGMRISADSGGDSPNDGTRFLEKTAYRFIHDRIQQAAYKMITEQFKNETHLKIGRLLLLQTREKDLSDRIFDIVNQLNFGRYLLASQQERTEVAYHNLVAGKKANTSVAYEQAFRYLKIGIELLDDNCWELHYDLSLGLYTEGVKAAYLRADFVEMDRLAETVLQKADKLLDKMLVYELKIETFQAQNKMNEALQLALQVLSDLGQSFPENPGYHHIMLALPKTVIRLIGKKDSDLSSLPEMTDPQTLATMRLLVSVTATAFMSRPNLVLLIVFRIVNLTLQHGNAPESDYGFAGFGFVLSALGLLNGGYRFGQLALSLEEKPEAKKSRAGALMLVQSFITHVKHHLRETLQPYLNSYQMSLQTGDWEYMTMSSLLYCVHSYYSGQPLDFLAQELEKYEAVIVKTRNVTYANYIKIYHQTVTKLMEPGTDPTNLSGDIYDENAQLPIHNQANDQTALFNVHSNKMILCYLLDRHQEAVENADITRKYLVGVQGMYPGFAAIFYDSLSRLAVFEESNGYQKWRILRLISRNQKALKKRARHAPMNYQHKFLLVEAEKARVQGKKLQAIEHYTKAIKSAHENEFLQEEALANELAGKFYLAEGQGKVARAYLLEAHYLYNRWGAKSKIRALESKYPQMQLSTHLPVQVSLDFEASITGGATSKVLDFSSMLKASQAISGEIELIEVLRTLMKLVIENAGAEKTFLILKENDELMVEAQISLENEEQIYTSAPLDESHLLSMSVVQYVIRTENIFLIADAIEETLISRDPYIENQKPKSILCIPVQYRGDLTGVIYMENNQVSGAFTPERVEVLQVLISQAAISLENARLYRNLKQSELKYRDIYENSVEGIFQILLGGKLISVNPATAQILGYDSPEEMMSGGLDPIQNSIVSIEDLREVIEQVNISGKVSDYTMEGRRKDGSLIYLSASVRGVKDENQEILYYEGSMIDITERIEAEKEIRTLNIELEQRVKDRTEDLNISLQQVEAANLKITDSINYAKRIQRSMLPAPELLNAHFSDSFVLWRPRDIVGGDFYYIDVIDGEILIAVIDCTGHGVPGAFMSIIAFMGLRRIIKEENIHQPSEILKRMNATIKTLLQKETEYATSNDGLDASICLVKPKENILAYSGTKMSLIYFQDNEPNLIKGDNHSIGDKRSDLTYDFACHQIPLVKDSVFYLFTDGYVDQTGGEKSMMFGKKRFQKLLMENHQRPFDEQRQILIDSYDAHRGNIDPVDDLTVIGFKI
jgi:PAS domain S-box-containing protein